MLEALALILYHMRVVGSSHHNVWILVQHHYVAHVRGLDAR